MVKKKEVSKKREAVFIICNLLISIIAFSFLIGLYDSKIVTAARQEIQTSGFIPDGKGGATLITLKPGETINTPLFATSQEALNFKPPIITVLAASGFITPTVEQQFSGKFIKDYSFKDASGSYKVSGTVAAFEKDAAGNNVPIIKPTEGYNINNNGQAIKMSEADLASKGNVKVSSDQVSSLQTFTPSTVDVSKFVNMQEGTPLIYKPYSVEIGGNFKSYDPNTDTLKLTDTYGNEFEVSGSAINKEVQVLKTDTGAEVLGHQFDATGSGAFFGNIAAGLQWGLLVAGGIQLVGTLLGLEQAQTNAMSLAALGGFTAYGLTKGIAASFFKMKTIWSAPGGLPTGVISNYWFATAGIVAAIIILQVMWKDQKTEIVTFTCKPWEAPVGGKDCEKCNKDAFRPCTEYRCKSLGQACELLNSGSGNESCVWVNPKDVESPIITTWADVLTSGYKYNPSVVVRPAKRGVAVERISGDKCIKAFTPIQFGLLTNEPSQCKIDYNHTAKFENMQYDFGQTNLYIYNHTEILSLPGPDAINALSPELHNNGEYTLFLRCQDKNGNANEDEFSVKFCVEKGEDTTPADIITTNFGTEAPFTFNTSSVNVELFVNEPAECKWSHDDKSYESMENNMTCQENIWEMNPDLTYKCIDNVDGLKNRVDNKIYFRCRDKPDAEIGKRNTNQQSLVLNLKGTQPIDIISLKPGNDTVKGFGDTIEVDFEVEVRGGYADKAFCYVSPTKNEQDYILFSETDARISKQRLDLPSGTYTYYIKCVDLGGNSVYTSTTFKVESDNLPPIITRAVKDNEQLKIATDEDSTCSYSTSCTFDIKDGTEMPSAETKEHIAVWDTTKAYYIKCRDKYENEPGPTQCTSIIRAYN